MAYEFNRFMSWEEAVLNFTMAGATHENLERMRAYIRGLLEQQREACAEACEAHSHVCTNTVQGGQCHHADAKDCRETPLVEIV